MHIKSKIFITDPKSSCWVRASAGTGKTKLLVDRVLSLLLSGVEFNKIVCITFTKAAAAEMGERIYNKLSEWTKLGQEELYIILEDLFGRVPSEGEINKAKNLFPELLEDMEGIKINTIHSFAQNILRRFPVEAGINHKFKIADDLMVKTLLERAKELALFDPGMTDILAKLSAYLNLPAFGELIGEIITNRNIIGLVNSNFSSSEEYKNHLLEIFAVENISLAELEQEFLASTNYQKIEEAAQLLAEGAASDITTSQKLYDFLQNKDNISIYSACFLTLKLEIKKNLATKALKDKYPALAEFLDLEANRIANYIDKKQSLITADLSSTIFALANKLTKLYDQLKRGEGVVDYDDLINLSAKLLNDPEQRHWVLFKLDQGVDHILIDEAQDTSFAQWQIIIALCEEYFAGALEERARSLFVVGDEKQSIYSFQGAEPRIMQIIQNYFGDNLHIIRLEESYRSSPEILALTNKLCNSEQLKPYLTYYEEPISHGVTREDYNGKITLWPVLEEENAARHLADNLAREISKWLEEGYYLPAKKRAIMPGDIMILLRRRNDFMHYLVSALEKYNIPIAGIDRLKLTDNLAIMDILSLLKFLLLPEDDLNLASLLKSPIFGLREEELFILCYDRGETSLWQRLQESSHINICQYLQELMVIMYNTTIYGMLKYIIDYKNARERFISYFGYEVNDLLDSFMDIAYDYEQNYPPVLQEFIYWFEHSDLEVKREMTQDSKLLRIMTIHAAKGLQAPIVILPDTTSIPTQIGKIIFDKEKGIYIFNAKTENDNIYCHRLRQRLKEEQIAEYWRLLYVAITRAEDELLVCGYNKASPNSWYNYLCGALTSSPVNTKDDIIA